MELEQVSYKNIECLFRHPNSPSHWITQIDDFEFMVPVEIWGLGESSKDKVCEVYSGLQSYIKLAQSYLTESGQHRDLGIDSPDWYPLWLEIENIESNEITIAFQLTGDDYGEWKVKFKHGEPTGMCRE
ncbi:hypothetical protein [Agaribacterium sp. ZY112]|uniref:hypothetical protein n=1 Tax=Agaribacterium sp. ZY112 TaxID=3233574 RepID=UPI0035246B98